MIRILKVFARGLNLIMLAVFVLVLYVAANLTVLPGTPLYVGTHREFFLRCRHLQNGSTPAQVLRGMNGYVYAVSNRTIDDSVAATAHPSFDRSASQQGADSSMVIYPNQQDTADWCVCYFKSNRLVRTRVDPD